MKRDWLVILDETCNLTRTPDFELASCTVFEEVAILSLMNRFHLALTLGRAGEPADLGSDALHTRSAATDHCLQ
jgi:hypothetical protein